MAKLEDHSIRIGVAVRIVARLFSVEDERSLAFRPPVGPAAVVHGEAEVTELGTPGDPAYRRVWRVPNPSSGASSIAAVVPGIKAGPDYLADGFELPPLPDPTLTASTTTTDSVAEEDAIAGPALGGTPGDDHVVFATVLARKVKLKLGPHRQADECDLELPLEAFPFPADGSLIRSILIEVRRGLIDADDWAAGMQGRRSKDGRPLTLPIVTDSDDPDFVGFVDVHRISVHDGLVTFKARGIAGVLLDAQVRGRKLETDVPVDEAVARFLSLFPAAVGLEVVWLGPAMPPTLGEAAPKAKTSKKGKPLKPPAKDIKGSAYDAIADYCLLAGVIPRFRGYRLELGPARTLDSDTATQAPRMVVGRNVVELEFEKKMSGTVARAVQVRSFDPDVGRLVVATWPEDVGRYGTLEPGQASKLPTTGPLEIPPGASAVEEKSPTVMTVYGISDPARLKAIAQCIFEEQARQEMGGSLKTNDVATFDGRAQGVADLLAMRPGDPLSIIIAPSVEASSGSYIQRIARLGDRKKAVDLLVSTGWRKDVAARVVDGILTTRRPLVFRVRALTFDHSLDGPTSTEIDFVNYIEVLDQILPQGGHRKAVALDGTASWGDKWAAIDADFLAGELTAEKADDLKRQIGEAEIRRRKALDVRPIREEF